MKEALFDAFMYLRQKIWTNELGAIIALPTTFLPHYSVTYSLLLAWVTNSRDGVGVKKFPFYELVHYYFSAAFSILRL